MHGSFNAETGMAGCNQDLHSGSNPWPPVSLSIEVCATSERVKITLVPMARTARMRGHVTGDNSYLQLLFDNNQVLCVCGMKGVVYRLVALQSKWRMVVASWTA